MTSRQYYIRPISGFRRSLRDDSVDTNEMSAKYNNYFANDIPEKTENVKRLRIKKRRKKRRKPAHKWTQREIYVTKNKSSLPPLAGGKCTKDLKSMKSLKTARKASVEKEAATTNFNASTKHSKKDPSHIRKNISTTQPPKPPYPQ